MPLMYTKSFSVPLSEVTPCHAQKPFHILNMLQDAADSAVESVQPGADYWNDGCGWMLLKYSIRLTRPLAAGDSGTINTGHVMLRDLYSARRFVIYDENERQFGMADSLWIYVDLKSRRPQRLSHRLPPSFAAAMEDPPFQPLLREPEKLTRADIRTQLHVRLGELDVNGHVNNAYYLSWAAEAVPKEVYMRCGIVGADIQYKREAVYGMDLVVSTQQLDELNYLHEIKSTEGTLLACCATRWAPLAERKP
ncbi:MAG: acyl-[acyl-carrier-protein] thioesterase [Pyramidobacter sp.]